MIRSHRKKSAVKNGVGQRAGFSRQLRLEPLEDRWLLAVFTVTNLNDAFVDSAGDAPGTLRQAIFDSNNSAGADTIEFSASLNGTIPLSQGELTIADDLTINGLGAGLLTIDAQGGSRLFNVDDLDDNNLIAVTISGLTLTGGRDLGAGGAIFSYENLLVADSVITGNEAQWGGGIYNTYYGELTLLRSTVSNNQALSPSPPSQGSGGGIYNAGGIAEILESTITGNRAPDGAGIRNVDGGLLDIVDSTISGNVADFAGGALSNDAGDALVLNSLVSGNSAEYGAGINNAYNGTLSIENSTISGNTASNSGGGVRNGDGYVLILDSTLHGNDAVYGGGLYVGTLETAPTIVRNSTISNNSASQGGGGIYNFLGYTIIEFSTITDNTSDAFLGSGVVTWGDVEFTLTEVYSSIIAGNHHTDVAIAGEPNTFVSDGYNLIGTGDAGIVFDAPGDQTGVTDPFLGPLADNGGPTFTHALLPGSPAIDAGDPAAVAGIDLVPTFDQRWVGFDRVVGSAIDIGAFELQAASPTLVGDYNGDGTVNAADYTVWRDTLGSTTDLRANGDDSNNVIDAADYDVWVANFGSALGARASVEQQVASANHVGEFLRNSQLSPEAAAIASGTDTPVRPSNHRSLNGGQECPPHVSARMLALLDLLDSLPKREELPKVTEWDFNAEDQRDTAARDEAFSSDLATEWP